jgi:thiamine-monophosphate kinase
VNVKDLGEFGLIARIAGRVRPGIGVETGIGDDAAVTKPSAGSLTLTTTDMLVEGVHFDLSLSDPLTLGRKSLSVNLSDIAAMGGEPRHFLLSMAIPSTISVEFLDDFIRGMLDRADEFGVSLIGGDTCSSKSGLVISVTVMGEQLPGKIIRRTGAVEGDTVFVTGTVGDSALGLEMLKRGERGGPATEKHLDPSPRVTEGVALAEAAIPTAMIDISDGLLADLGHILERSEAGARLELDKIPLSSFFLEKCSPLSDEYISLALAGGEDYELLFTAPACRKGEVFDIFERLGTPVTAIGEITADGRLSIITSGGAEYAILKRGFNHFA